MITKGKEINFHAATEFSSNIYHIKY